MLNGPGLFLVFCVEQLVIGCGRGRRVFVFFSSIEALNLQPADSNQHAAMLSSPEAEALN